MLWVLVGAVLPVMLLAAPPPINKLALFPDKSAWCEAKNFRRLWATAAVRPSLSRTGRA